MNIGSKERNKMERLIDADLLIKELKGCTCTDKHDERIIKEFVIHIVKQQSTAFDIEAIVKELEEYVKQHLEYYQIGEDFLGYGKCISLKKAIEIVKGGVK